MIIKPKIIIFSIFILIGYSFLYLEFQNLTLINSFKKSSIKKNNQTNFVDVKKIDKLVSNKKEIINDFSSDKNNAYNKTQIKVLQGQTFFSILSNKNLSNKMIFKIVNKVEDLFDLSNLRVNQKITFFNNNLGELKKIEINYNIDEVLIIELSENINVKINKLEKIFFQESKEFSIINSLYADGIKNKLPQEILIKLIKLFSFDLDFQRDIRNGTVVSVSFDYNLIKDTNTYQYKDINYAMIDIEGKKIEYFKFLTNDGYIDYFNREGKNVKKSILKTPLDGARISSNYGMRKHPISGFNKMHKGVDFAAPKGTPIYAGGNGVVEYIGNNGGYGKYIRIRHNNEYKTAYAHLSAYKKGISKGVRVNQGEIIGYVGSTGRSTGPHLHYEIIFQNKQINPLKLNLPSGKVLEGNELKKFIKEYKKIYANHLYLLYE